PGRKSRARMPATFTVRKEMQKKYGTPPAPAARGPGEQPGASHQPAHAIRLRNVRAAIWANQGEKGTFYSVIITRSYRDQLGNWDRSESFGRDDLLLVAKVADLAHTWVSEQTQVAGQEVPC